MSYATSSRLLHRYCCSCNCLLLPLLLLRCQALVEALATNSSLQDLDLRSNAIGLTGCRLLSALLQDHNSSIRALSLAGNMEEPDGTQAPVLQV
jgi:Ran GTPase-activating protein (RanGAP) involved in mRNA processing and transport